MQTIALVRANNLAQLMDELIAGVPTFLRTTVDADGRNVATADSGVVEGSPTTIRITFADNIPAVDVQAVIDAHVPGQSVAELIGEAGVTPILLNGWVDFGPNWSTAGYVKDGQNIVHLKGLIKSGIIADNTVLFNLPAGYRPTQRLVFPIAFAASGIDLIHGRVDVKVNGDVVVLTVTANAFLSLEGISFLVV